MTTTEAIDLLTQNPKAAVCFTTRDATLSHYSRVPVWLEGGELVRSHPTDDRGQSIAAPVDVQFFVDDGVREAF